MAFATVANAASSHFFADRLEMLDWADPERAAQILSAGPGPDELRSSAVEALEVRGMIYTDVHRDAEVEATIGRLQALGRAGNTGATAAEHYVRAYSLYQRDQYAAASVEIRHVTIDALHSPTEQYRMAILRANILRTLGQAEAALPFLEQALDVAQDMHDDARRLHAILWLGRLYADTGNFDRALAEFGTARRLAASLGDEAAFVELESRLADIADRRGNRIEERRASLAALDHARLAGSNKWLAQALLNLGDSYLKARDFSESLKYSKQALTLILKLHESGEEPIVRFNAGLAYIGLGEVKQGEKLAEEAIAKALAGDNIIDAKELLREYANALEHAGYLMMAIQVYHRYEEASEKFMDYTRQRAFVEMSAKFDDERKARELELLRRDNELKASEMHGQHLQEQLAIGGGVFALGICAALLWAITRVRRANDRLRYNSERDALTGLRNRRYFNESVLSVEGDRPVSGCVLLADLDHFKRINDTLGHPAGDAVLATISQRLAAALRESDTLVRWGGEEFLAVLNPITPEQADATVERLLQAVRRDPVFWKGQPIECTISIGYGVFPLAGEPAAVSLD
ncbi:MAG: diguanylate cyclase, partial [Pseudomonadota bacterium]|nr:diguanylate cyclase [Pseudomonadota bacterium]